MHCLFVMVLGYKLSSNRLRIIFYVLTSSRVRMSFGMSLIFRWQHLLNVKYIVRTPGLFKPYYSNNQAKRVKYRILNVSKANLMSVLRSISRRPLVNKDLVLVFLVYIFNSFALLTNYFKNWVSCKLLFFAFFFCINCHPIYDHCIF